MMLPLTGRFEWVWLVFWGSAYVYYLVLKLPKGVTRLLALLPLLPFYILVPWRAQTSVERSLMSFFFLWMGAFKLIMVAYEYGPAKDAWIMSSFPCFLTGISFSMHMNTGLLPATKPEGETVDFGVIRGGNNKISESEGKTGNGLVSRKPGGHGMGSSVQDRKRKDILFKIKRRSTKNIEMPRWMHYLSHSKDWKIMLLRCLFYFIFTGIWLQQYMTEDQMPALVLYLSYSFLLYTGVLLVFEFPAAVAASFFNVELPAQFNMPFLATSLSDFWGRRWNLLVNNLLRIAVYNPILEAYSERSGKKPTFEQKGIAVLVTFAVSGIMHEIIFIYMSQGPPTFELTMFFVLNGAATILESWLRTKKYNPPKLVGWTITLSFIFFTAAWLFYPPLVRAGCDKQNIKDMNAFFFWVRDLVFDSLRQFFSFGVAVRD